MSAIFYDKEGIKLDKEIQALNDRADKLQSHIAGDTKYIRNAQSAFAKHHALVDERITKLAKQQGEGRNIRNAAGIMVGGLLAAAVFNGVCQLLDWVAKKLRTQSPPEGPETLNRRHARDWKPW
jgi:hypothetical protein